MPTVLIQKKIISQDALDFKQTALSPFRERTLGVTAAGDTPR